ncbi:PREDICTED: plexin domain-containing protein 2-like [Branchiostoma belcheri]|uniref:Plexin domain-containing protein 2-like n=1 Tax=Branchiostoma belcheri TaxID=7741 RepID=A0A6P4ZNP9_BRABE|nr:PREDICTED: plexin domain-containing protein 2-like [Branchiostoma belcheri]
MGRARRNSPKTTPAPTLVTKKHTPQTARPVIQQNSHRYYISQYYPVSPPGDSHWEDMGSGDAELVVGTGSPPVHHKQNKPVSLSFDFKFYGHFIRNISISTRGYINTGPYPSYVTDTQYIAPLSDPRLDSSLDKFASVRYKDSGTSFTVEWNRLYLTNQTKLGPFIFQTTLIKDGRIVFAYKEAPSRLIDDTMRDVKVGVSDAYIPSLVLDGEKPVIEYHRVELGLEKVHSNAVVILVPQQTCGELRGCSSCINSSIVDFECGWCQKVNRCSDGNDWLTASWRDAACDDLVTCGELRGCSSCINSSIVDFECGWCQKVNRCSDGNDWLTASWRDAACDDLAKSPPCLSITRSNLTTFFPRTSVTTSTPTLAPASSSGLFVLTTNESRPTPGRAFTLSPQRVTPGPNLFSVSELPRNNHRTQRTIGTNVIVGILVGIVILIAIVAWTVHVCSKMKAEADVVVVQI